MPRKYTYIMHKATTYIGRIGIVAIIGYSMYSIVKICMSLAPDFLVYFSAARHMSEGTSLYATSAFTLFAYPPISALFFTPFSHMPFAFAQEIFILVSYIAIFASVWICFLLLDIHFLWQKYFAIIALTLLSFPAKFTLGMGQSNYIAYFFVLLAIFLERKKLFTLSGILLGIGCIFKPIFIFFLLYFLLKKSWKTCISFIGIGVLFVLVEFLFFPHAFSDWQEYLFKILPHLFTSNGREVYYNQGIMGFIARLTPILFLRSWVTFACIIFVLSVVIFKIYKTYKNHLFHLALILCVLPLIDSLSWQHHFIVLLFPFLYVWVYGAKTIPTKILFAISYGLVSINIVHPQVFVHFPFFLILSHTFFGAVLLLGLLLYGQRSKTGI